MTNFITHFEDLSDEIIISIVEYLPLEDYITTFASLNARLTCLTFDHPWTQHHLNIQTMDDGDLRKKIDLIEKMQLISIISSIHIRPFSLYHTISTFQQLKSIAYFINLKALSLQYITLDEAELIFTQENLTILTHLTRLRITFSYGAEQADYQLRLERLLSRILPQPSLRYCAIEASRPVNFTELQSPCSVKYLAIDYCSFQSLYTLFEFTPALRHLTATIAVHSESKIHKISLPPLLNSVKVNLSIPAFADLTLLFRRLPKLRKVHLITQSIIEPITFTSSWFSFITDSLPALIQFKRESNVLLENIEEYIQAFRWPNGWHLEERSLANGKNYSRITISNTRY